MLTQASALLSTSADEILGFHLTTWVLGNRFKAGPGFRTLGKTNRVLRHIYASQRALCVTECCKIGENVWQIHVHIGRVRVH